MNFKILKKLSLLLFALLLINTAAHADELIMVRSTEAFPETMLMLQSLIKQQGYKPSRVQRVDIGLTKSGYKTDKYRVVFFGKADEIKKVSTQLPELIPYLPLKISIFAEDGQTILTTLDPMSFNEMYPDSKLTPVFKQWTKDIHAIFKQIRDNNTN